MIASPQQRQQLVPFVVGGFVTLAIGLFALWLWRQERANPGPLRSATGWFALGCVLAPGEAADSPRAMAQASTLRT